MVGISIMSIPATTQLLQRTSRRTVSTHEQSNESVIESSQVVAALVTTKPISVFSQSHLYGADTFTGYPTHPKYQTVKSTATL